MSSSVQPERGPRPLWNSILGLVNSDTLQLLLEGLRLVKAMSQEKASGLYEVLDFEHTLELCDPLGQQAIFHKRATVRLLQDHVAAYVDQAWGKGEIFADYRVSPGVPVDRYRYGHKYYVLISLREIKRRGDILHLVIDRTVHDGFNVKTGWSETAVNHSTKQFRLGIVFPANRPPQRVTLIEANRNAQTALGEDHRVSLPDGRIEVSWETSRPHLFETYTLRWTW